MSQRFFTGRLALMQFGQERAPLSRSPRATLQSSCPSRMRSSRERRALAGGSLSSPTWRGFAQHPALCWPGLVRKCRSAGPRFHSPYPLALRRRREAPRKEAIPRKLSALRVHAVLLAALPSLVSTRFLKVRLPPFSSLTPLRSPLAESK